MNAVNNTDDEATEGIKQDQEEEVVESINKMSESLGEQLKKWVKINLS